MQEKKQFSSIQKIDEKIDNRQREEQMLHLSTLRQYVKFFDTITYDQFHPLSMLTRLLQTKILIDFEEYENLSRCVSMNNYTYDNVKSTSDTLLKKYIVVKHIKMNQYMRDMIFFDDFFVLDTSNKNILKSIPMHINKIKQNKRKK